MKTHPSLLRAFVVVAAVIGWAALVLQFYLSLGLAVANGWGIGGGIAIYFGFFTILTNILAALALTAPLVAHDSFLGRFFLRPGIITAIAAAIAVVGVVYSLLLRAAWNPQGWQLVADRALHDIMPVLFLIYWWFAVPKKAVHWTDIPRWWLYPFGYIVYVMVRGVLTGLYPYTFIDVGALGYGKALVNAAVILLGFSLIALILVGVNALKRGSSPPY